MTRTTVTLDTNGTETKLADVFHNFRSEGPAAEIDFYLQGNPITIPTGECVDIHIKGFDYASVDEIDGSHEDFQNTFEVYVNDTRVADGVTSKRVSSPVVVELGGGRFEAPPNQQFRVDVYGDEAGE